MCNFCTESKVLIEPPCGAPSLRYHGSMQRDYLGNPVGAQRDPTLHGIDDFIEGYLAYESRAERILAAADAEPESCLANAYSGMLWMLLEAPEGARHAAKYLGAAERAAPHATRREQLNTAMLRAWVDDDMARTLRLCDQISDEFPRDLVIVKTHQYFEFNRGNAPEMLRVALKAASQSADVPYMHGMTAFAYEQCHLLDEAESEARIALDMRRKEPWAQHALAHVFLTRGQIDEGARFLEQAADTWTGLNSFMLTHIWWHMALFYLSQGRNREVLDLYDRHCWGIAKDYSQDQIGAVSLLARCELAGIDVGPRWEDLGRHLAARAGYDAAVFDAAISVWPGPGGASRSGHAARSSAAPRRNRAFVHARGLAGRRAARLRRAQRPCPRRLRQGMAPLGADRAAHG